MILKLLAIEALRPSPPHPSKVLACRGIQGAKAYCSGVIPPGVSGFDTCCGRRFVVDRMIRKATPTFGGRGVQDRAAPGMLLLALMHARSVVVPTIPWLLATSIERSAPRRARGRRGCAHLQVSATTFTDSTCTVGGRSTFGLPEAPSSAGGVLGCCTAPVTSTFLLMLVANSDCDDPASTYIAADPVVSHHSIDVL
jgi:hypothetical protein